MATADFLAFPGLTAHADMTGEQFHAVRLNVANDFRVQAMTNANAQHPIGILQDKPDIGEPATVAYIGVCKVELGGTVVRGAKLASNNAGELVTDAEVVTGGAVDLHHIGVALESGADGNIVYAYIFPTERIGSE